MSLAALVLLERLSPVERAVFVLRESFDFEFAEIASIVERSEDNCRQILTRARRRVADDRPRFDADPTERRTLAARFLAAARDGDLDGLVALLAPERGPDRRRRRPSPRHPAPDGRRRAPSPVPSPRSTARSTPSASPSNRSPSTASRASAPSTREGLLVNVVSFDVFEGQITTIHSIVNPDKLSHLGPTSQLGLRPSAQS